MYSCSQKKKDQNKTKKQNTEIKHVQIKCSEQVPTLFSLFADATSLVSLFFFCYLTVGAVDTRGVEEGEGGYCFGNENSRFIFEKCYATPIERQTNLRTFGIRDGEAGMYDWV